MSVVWPLVCITPLYKALSVVGELTKVRNNLKEFCPTETLHIANVQSRQFLFCVGSDVDSGDAYINSTYITMSCCLVQVSV